MKIAQGLLVTGFGMLVLTDRMVLAQSPCEVSADLVPQTAVVGQQLIYRVRILRSEGVESIDWVDQPVFPGFRSVWLPGLPEEAVSGKEAPAVFAREESRAVFPMRTGLLEIPAARLRCVQAGSASGHTSERIVEVPALSLRVKPPPQRGAPIGFSGVVGMVRVSTHAEPAALRLGETLRVSVHVRGPANLWNVDPPFAGGAAFGGAEVFARRPSLDYELGGRLQVRRLLRFVVVPIMVVSLVIPEVAIPFYDPDRGRYDVARSPEIRLEIQPRRKPDLQPDGADDSLQHAQDPTAPPRITFGSAAWEQGLLAALILAAAGGGLILGWQRRRRQPWRRIEDARKRARAAADAGDRRGEAEAYSRALREALVLVAPELGEPGELEDLEACVLRQRLAGLSGLGAVAEQLLALERARYSRDPDPLALDEIAELFGRLRQRTSLATQIENGESTLTKKRRSV